MGFKAILPDTFSMDYLLTWLQQISNGGVRKVDVYVLLFALFRHSTVPWRQC